MKIFISMGMKGIPTDKIRETMKETFEQIKAEYPEAELIDSIVAEETDLVDDNAGMFYLAKSIEIMTEADKVFFIDDYSEYRGCSIEKTIAEAYGKECTEFTTK